METELVLLWSKDESRPGMAFYPTPTNTGGNYANANNQTHSQDTD